MKKLFYVSMIALSLSNLSAQKTYNIGDEIEDFALTNAANTINGLDMPVSLADYNNVKGFIIVFTDSECVYSQISDDKLIDLHRRYVMRGYPMIAVNSNRLGRAHQGELAAMKTISKEKRYPFAYLHDNRQELAMKFGLTHTPQVYIVQQKRTKNILRFSGSLSNSEAQTDVFEALNTLIKGDLPIQNKIEAKGCVVNLPVHHQTDADVKPLRKRRRNPMPAAEQ